MDEITRAEIIDFLRNRVQNCKVMVVGDIMLDRYFYGHVNRISPEAPVPINCIKKKKNVLGGAANVANNLSKLGCNVYLVGVIGNDHHGRLLTRELNNQQINITGVMTDGDLTTTKVRVLGGHQQMMRLDFEEIDKLTLCMFDKMKKYISRQISEGIDAIIISDYNKGICTYNLCQYIIAEANKIGVPVLVDPKGKDWQKYTGASYITPNIKETGEVIGRNLSNDIEKLRFAANELRANFNIKSVMITRSEKGISLFGGKEITVPTVAKDVFDVSGAGDTVISAFTVARCCNLKEEDALIFANFAAGIEVGKVGTYAVSKDEIIKECLI